LECTLNILPTRAALTRFIPNMDTSCPICGHHLETLLHLLWSCPLARALWFNSVWEIKTDLFQFEYPFQLIEKLVYPLISLNLDKIEANKFLLGGSLIIEQVWSVRNRVVHDNGLICMDMLITGIWNRNAEHWASQFSQHVVLFPRFNRDGPSQERGGLKLIVMLLWV
jgi:hypothetical protein